MLPDVDQEHTDRADDDDDRDLGGLFKVVSKERSGQRKSDVEGGVNDRDCSYFPVEAVRDWSLEQVRGVFCTLVLYEYSLYHVVQ